MRGEHPLPNLTQVLYKSFARPVFFSLDPEKAHNLAFSSLSLFSNFSFLFSFFKPALVCEDKRLEVSLGSLKFPNPVGLAAGFDKGADLIKVWNRFGFGFVETGTFTPKPQEGQNKPRLFRYPSSKALVNRMGFNNPGTNVIPDRFFEGKWPHPIPIGINIGKNKVTPNEQALNDYLSAFEKSFPFADYITINVSSPNTPGLRDLQQVEHMKELLSGISGKNKELANGDPSKMKQVFLKLSPDLDDESLSDLVRVCLEKDTGIIATNTTLDHSSLGSAPKQVGGLSGAPLKNRSNQVLAQIAKRTKKKVPLIGVGGIFTADDAYEKIRLGAHLVQIYTGWIYQGPSFVKMINQGLLKRLKQDGFATLTEACGSGL